MTRIKRHRRRMIVLLVAVLALLTWLVWGMVTDLRSRPVSYRVEYITPVNSYLCPGDALRYEVQLAVTQTPVILHIVEAWCRPGVGGVCERASTTTYEVPVLTPRSVYTLASRTVPDTPFFHKPGEQLEFHHATTDGKTVTGYIVGPVIIRDNCEAPEGGIGGAN